MKSPCIDVCIFDSATGWCNGCGRTLPECRAWKKARPFALKRIAADLPRRIARLEQRDSAT